MPDRGFLLVLPQSRHFLKLAQMNLYTFIVSYNNGIYMSQHKGATAAEAYGKWLKSKSKLSFFVAMAGFLTERDRDNMLQDKDEPVKVRGLKDVWCISLMIKGDIAIVNIVKGNDA